MVSFWGWGSLAAAQDVQIVVTDPNADAGALRAALEPLVADNFRLEDQTEFLEQMAMATALSARGMGVDYASSPQRFVLGGSLGPALKGKGSSLGYGDGLLPQGGFAFQGSLMAGLNLGAFADKKHPLRRFVLYGHGMGAGGGREPFTAAAVNGGVHLQSQLLRVRDMGKAGWGGLALTTGFEHTSYLLTLERQAPIETELATWIADGEYQVRAITNSIPVELSTNMRVSFLSVFGGGGVDFLLTGDADSIIDLRGDIRDDSGRVVGTAVVTATDSTDITGVTPRVFGGLQLNIFMVKLYGQVNVAIPEGIGVHGGLRVAM
jgi:hypothetical protein